MAKKSEKVKSDLAYSITLVIVYFGKLPGIAEFFLYSCGKNQLIRFLLFTDQEMPLFLPDNVEYIYFTKEDFANRVKSKTGLKIKIGNPYKLCDFKPLFGHLFEDFLISCNFWGYCDTDQIFGDIEKFLTNEIMTHHDVITARKESLAGNFTLYKNIPALRELYRLSDCWRQIMMDHDRLYCFDEKCKKRGVLLSDQITVRLRARLMRGATLNGKIADMNAVLENTSNIKCYYGDFLLSDMILKNKHVPEWEVIWEKGRLHEVRSNRSIMYFHFYHLKYQPDFKIPSLELNRTVSKIRITPSRFEVIYSDD